MAQRLAHLLGNAAGQFFVLFLFLFFCFRFRRPLALHVTIMHATIMHACHLQSLRVPSTRIVNNTRERCHSGLLQPVCEIRPACASSPHLLWASCPLSEL
jgi:hypothetical protein